MTQQLMTPENFVTALRRYISVPHSSNASFVVETPNGPKGFLRCVGLPLAALRDIGVLPAEFSLDLSDARLLTLLHEHFIRVNSLVVGDLFFIRLKNSSMKHLAVFTEETLPLGRYIHCLNDVRGVGRVWECSLERETLDAIEGIYRLKIWGDS